jgi:hypothetical protein
MLSAFSSAGLARAEIRQDRAVRASALALEFLGAYADATVAGQAALPGASAAARSHYIAARDIARGELAALAGEAADDPTLQPLLEALDQTANEPFRALDRALGLGRVSAPSMPSSESNLEPGHVLDELRGLLAALHRHIAAADRGDAAWARSRAATIRTLNLGLVLVALAFAGGVGRWFLNRARDLEKMITVCAWTRRVLWRGKWISFEEYLIERFAVRCTHGICEEAAAEMKRQATRLEGQARLNRGHSAAPFA